MTAPDRIWAYELWASNVPRAGDWTDEKSEAPDGSSEYIRADLLSDPIAVHANLLRGTIAKPTVEQIVHLYGMDALMKALEHVNETPKIEHDAGNVLTAGAIREGSPNHAYRVGYAAGRAAALREAAATVQAGDTVQNIQRRILALIEER